MFFSVLSSLELGFRLLVFDIVRAILCFTSIVFSTYSCGIAGDFQRKCVCICMFVAPFSAAIEAPEFAMRKKTKSLSVSCIDVVCCYFFVVVRWL